MIGRMDQTITFQRLAEAPDGGGGVVRAWADLDENPNVWAEAKVIRGAEAFDEGRPNATMRVKFTVYSRRDISERDRLVWLGETYNIRSIFRPGRDRRMAIEAERGVAS